MSDAPLLDEATKAVDGGKKLEIPRVVAAPVEAALATVGGLAASGAAQVGERGLDLSAAGSRARPWLEFADFTAFGLPTAGPGEVLTRFRANAQWFAFNYVMIGFGMAAISVITKPLTLLGAVFLAFVYFQLFGAATEGQEEVSFLGFHLDDKERTGLMVVLTGLVIMFAAGGLQILVSILTGTVVVAVVHGCLRKPHPDALPADCAEV